VHGWRCRAGTTNYVAIDATGAPGTVFSGQNFMFQTDGTGSVTTNRTGTVDNWHLGMFGVSPAFCPTNPLAFWPTRPLTPGGSCIVNSNGTMYGLKAAPAGTLWVSTNIIF
jgi:hypothetical protein